ncbi:hypothetical protein ACFRFH_08815 [Leifsonia sp. NPDC056824]|uniref:hypothetical protein n=1 Tax=Leifsonia sp. NPDC056824 TaxID=3345953 RepID=UPI003697D490
MTIAMDRPGAELTPADALAPAAATPETVSWSTPARWLWVAGTPTQYVGMVDRNLDGYVATGFDGHDLGVFAARSDAQAAVCRHWSAAGDEG